MIKFNDELGAYTLEIDEILFSWKKNQRAMMKMR